MDAWTQNGIKVITRSRTGYVKQLFCLFQSRPCSHGWVSNLRLVSCSTDLLVCYDIYGMWDCTDRRLIWIGCGKTALVQALASESMMNVMSINGPEIFSKYLGDTELKIRRLFATAKRIAPCILFIDELDAIGSKRGICRVFLLHVDSHTMGYRLESWRKLRRSE